MSIYFDQITEIMGKGPKLTPTDIREIKRLEELLDEDEIEKMAWIWEGLFLYTNDTTNKNFFDSSGKRKRK